VFVLGVESKFQRLILVLFGCMVQESVGRVAADLFVIHNFGPRADGGSAVVFPYHRCVDSMLVRGAWRPAQGKQDGSL
jgi:hypothetical protein